VSGTNKRFLENLYSQKTSTDQNTFDFTATSTRYIIV